MTGWKNDTAAHADILISNDRQLVHECKERMHCAGLLFDTRGHDVFTREEYVRFDLEDWLKWTLVTEPTDAADDDLPQAIANRVHLAIQAFAEDCDFSELARHYMDMAKEDE